MVSDALSDPAWFLQGSASPPASARCYGATVTVARPTSRRRNMVFLATSVFVTFQSLAGEKVTPLAGVSADVSWSRLLPRRRRSVVATVWLCGVCRRLPAPPADGNSATSRRRGSGPCCAGTAQPCVAWSTPGLSRMRPCSAPGSRRGGARGTAGSWPTPGGDGCASTGRTSRSSAQGS